MGKTKISWDEDARRDYLLGFARRKAARKEHAKKEMIKAKRDEEIQANKEYRKDMKNWMSQYKRSRKMIVKENRKCEERNKDDDSKQKDEDGDSKQKDEDHTDDDTSPQDENFKTFNGSFYGQSRSVVTVSISNVIPMSNYDLLRAQIFKR
ncbi:nucleolar 12, 25 kDa protein [Gregarina niphandrodes]|uniref:Nucleolar 12, 25 kDa protein n=1 Tax=Gregarina niphandrodes TaxID=110365 RepID=A0A023AZQ7_GRENI|nr:nucleolar 12, 25 kDa protein [Gregarina niphandrodes]EZG44308.1 nucleolar 12, 25 kDa protein [Gregarina niphandrodes]|eukprot:XP_011132716.1 nucleolar 12, 25 kDa protein [Gregarina niphandrodes]